MRAARLLQMLILLQNRGRQHAGQLAEELEVSRRTILRDVDAMTEAGLPVIVHRGNGGGIELGFNYRTRLTGLARDEAEALGILLARESRVGDAVGLGEAARRARTKLIESLPDRTRETARQASQFFHETDVQSEPVDPRIPALADAVRHSRAIRIRARSAEPQSVWPTRLTLSNGEWFVTDALSETEIPLKECGDINISGANFGTETNGPVVLPASSS